jgi:hypothetical protein
MKRISSYLFALMAFASLSFLTGCGEDVEDPATPLPAADGTIIIDFTNFPNTGTPTVDAASGDVITVSVRMQKSPNGTRPQKLRVWEATGPNLRGTQVGGTIDLRNVDDQTKTIDYSVPNSSGTIYLYFEVDESAGKFSRKTLQVNIVSSKSVASWTGLVLGSQTNNAGSRVSSATGDIYKVCDLAENMKYVDITYAVLPKTGPTTPTLLSNPQRVNETLATSGTCTQDNSPINTGGGTATYFATTTSINFDSADATVLSNLNVTQSSPQKINVAANNIYAFLNSNGKKGLIRVKSINLNPSASDAGTITIDIKVQR